MVFIPTYLYIKQHSITGKLYFGKTTSKNLEKYLGSGIRWTNHIKKHGKNFVTTVWYCVFFDKESIQEFALNFSRQERIVESGEWLNLKDENGLDGGFSEQCRIASIKANTGKIHKPEVGLARSRKLKGRPRTEAAKLSLRKPKSDTSNMRASKSDSHKDNMKQPQLLVICPHCNKTGGHKTMPRWHFDNCKFKPNRSIV